MIILEQKALELLATFCEIANIVLLRVVFSLPPQWYLFKNLSGVLVKDQVLVLVIDLGF